MVAAAVIGGAALSAGVGAISSNSAADTQASAAKGAQQISQNEFNTITQQEQPFMNAGVGAQNELNYLLGIGPNGATPNQSNGIDPSSGYRIGAGGQIGQGIQSPFGGSQNGFGAAVNNGQIRANPGVGASGTPGTPGAPTTSPAGGYGSLLSPFTADTFKQYSPAYQFQQQQGLQGVLNGNSSGAGALSGSASKDLIDYNQNLANTSFNTAFNQYQTQQGNIYSRLAGVAQLGQNAAANTGAQGVNLAGQAAGSANAAGAYQAAGTVGIGNAISGGIGSAAPWLSSVGGGGSSNPSLWDTENPSNFTDFGGGV